jgi:hypothetical protein
MPALRNFKDQFASQPSGFPFISNGLFGYFGFPAVEGFEDIQLSAHVPEENRIPAAIFRCTGTWWRSIILKTNCTCLSINIYRKAKPLLKSAR